MEALAQFNYVHASAMMRRASFEAAGAYSPNPTRTRCEDWDLWLRFSAAELSGDEATVFYRDLLVPYVDRQRPILRSFVRWLLRDTLADLPAAARTRPVFELRAQPG